MMSEHLIVTRFAVPHEDPDKAEIHCSPQWLEERLALFRRYYVPSVSRLGVRAVLLCGSRAQEQVRDAVADLPWVRVVEQEDWSGGLPQETDKILTRMDSDDALRAGWFERVSAAPSRASVIITRQFLRYDAQHHRLHHYRRREPSPLAAFRPGHNPYASMHKRLDQRSDVHEIEDAFLLQVAHGGNLKNHRPRWWRIDRAVRGRSRVLAEFGLTESREGIAPLSS
ncbi:MAG: hypothetical protein AAGD01_19175 [Acidobacteriota bacterium]